MTIYLLRHTSVDVPKGVCYGQNDVPLYHTYPQEFSVVKKRFDSMLFDAVYSSPLARCSLLANSLSDNVIFDKRLMELNFGAWEGKSWSEIYESEQGKLWFADYINTPCPSGESTKMMEQRIAQFILDLPKDKPKILLVTHCGVIRLFMKQCYSWSYDKAFDFQVGFGEFVAVKKK